MIATATNQQIELSIMLGAAFGGLLLEHISVAATFIGGTVLLVLASLIVGNGNALAETLAKKPVATSFVGALAGTLVAGEILRALHDGVRCELVQMQLRYNQLPGVITKSENYVKRVARSGFTNVLPPEKLAA